MEVPILLYKYFECDPKEAPYGIVYAKNVEDAHDKLSRSGEFKIHIVGSSVIYVHGNDISLKTLTPGFRFGWDIIRPTDSLPEEFVELLNSVKETYPSVTDAPKWIMYMGGGPKIFQFEYAPSPEFLLLVSYFMTHGLAAVSFDDYVRQKLMRYTVLDNNSLRVFPSRGHLTKPAAK